MEDYGFAQELQDHLRQMAAREEQLLMSSLSEESFQRCVKDFRTRHLSQKENHCISTYVEKWMNVTKRVSLRFAEQNNTMEAQQQISAQLSQAPSVPPTIAPVVDIKAAVPSS